MSSKKISEPVDDEDDYMNMTFDDTQLAPKQETLTQKKKRLAREAEVKGRPKSKAQLAEEERQKRDSALNSTTLDANSKGFKMMTALGYKPGSALGTLRTRGQHERDERLLEPIGLEMKDSRSGVGADAEKKRKFREEVEARRDTEKRSKIEAGEFRERQQKEREEKKMEGQMWGAMKICERLEEEGEQEDGVEADMQSQAADTSPSLEPDLTSKHSARHKSNNKPLKAVNVLWRALVKRREINDRDRRMRYDLHQSLSRRPDYLDPDEDVDHKIALGHAANATEEAVDLDDEDDELDAFEALSTADRLSELVAYLRDRWNYCFWCKFRYPDSAMDGCPGKTEEDHD